jgi:integrase/recombinase XerD
VSDDELVIAWCKWMRARNFSPITLRCYRETLRPFGFWLADHRRTFATARSRDIDAWLASRKLMPSTRRTVIARIGSFYRWAVRAGFVPTDPSQEVARPRMSRYLPRPAPTERVRAVLAACDDRVAAMICLGAYCGMRRFEIAKLRVEDLEFACVPPTVKIRGKGQVDRRVPLNPAVTAALARHGLPARGWVFPSPRSSGPISAQRCGRLIADALSSSDGRVTAHQLRHWFGTELYRGSGGDLRLTQECLGHQSIATTALYTAWDSGKAAAAVDTLNMGELSGPSSLMRSGRVVRSGTADSGSRCRT